MVKEALSILIDIGNVGLVFCAVLYCIYWLGHLL